jgi:hypothetical protein
MKKEITKTEVITELKPLDGGSISRGEYAIAATLSGANGSTIYFLEPDWVCMELLEMRMLQEQGLLRMY